MRNEFIPLKKDRLEASLKRLAELEHELLMALLAHNRMLKQATPNLAAFEYAMSGRTGVQRLLLDKYKDEPLLSTSLPLLDMKVGLIAAKYPNAERELRDQKSIHDMPRLLPMPPKE